MFHEVGVTVKGVSHGEVGRLCFVLDLQDLFLTLRVCTYTTESVVLVPANEFDAGRRGESRIWVCRREVGGWNRPEAVDELAD